MKTTPLLLSLLLALPAFAEQDRMSMEQAKEKAKQAGAEAKRATKGTVDSEDTRRRVETTARKVSGVTQVRNELHAKN